MKQHSTNYQNTFIEVAEDCAANIGETPPIRGDKKSVANLQFEMLHNSPYQYTSDEVFFAIFASRKDLISEEMEVHRQQFFSKGQPCFRASPLTKRYGWGVHSDAHGKVALYALDSEAYQSYINQTAIVKVKAMRSSKK